MSGAQDWHTPPFSLTVPPFSIPGQARIFIGPDLPPPLDTYVFTDRAGYGNTYAAAIVFYNDDITVPLDDTYNYLGIVQNIGAFAALHMGSVVNGSVREVVAGVPAAQIWGGEGSSAGTQKWITAGIAALEAYGATGQVLVRGTGGASVQIDNDASGANMIISALGGTAFMFLTGVTIDLNATVDLTLQGVRAYLLTQNPTVLCNAALFPVPAAYTNVPNVTQTLATVTTNAKYKVSIGARMGMNPAGLTILNGRLLVDGVAQTQIISLFLDEVRSENHPLFASGTLAVAGNHTFTFQAQDVFGTGVCDVAANDTTMTVELFESGG